jgi:hypothetical protein
MINPEPRPSRGLYDGWDFVVRSYDDKGRFCVETVHRDVFSLEMELDAIKNCDRTAYVWSIGKDGRPVGVDR